MYSNRFAGLLSFVGASQFLIFMLICEALYPGYSMSDNMISDLGIGSTAAIFNSSIIVLGLLIILSAITFHSFHRNKIFTILLILTGIGAMGVGLFPENMRPYHEIFAGITFIFGGLSEILSFTLLRFPMSIAVIFLGGLTLGSLVLFVLGIHLGLGPGGMERMIVYPVILWGASFGGLSNGLGKKIISAFVLCALLATLWLYSVNRKDLVITHSITHSMPRGAEENYARTS